MSIQHLTGKLCGGSKSGAPAHTNYDTIRYLSGHTLHNVCAVPRGVFSTVGDIMSTVGNILSTVGDVQYRGGIMINVRRYLEHRGGYHEYCGGLS